MLAYQNRPIGEAVKEQNQNSLTILHFIYPKVFVPVQVTDIVQHQMCMT